MAMGLCQEVPAGMRPIPLISAGQVAVFADLLDDAGISADRHLESARLSPKFREDPAGFLPGRSVRAGVAPLGVDLL